MKKNFTSSLILSILLAVIVTNSFSQTAIIAATTIYNTSAHDTTYITTGAPGSSFSGSTYVYNYGTLSGTTNNEQQLTSFLAGGKTYSFVDIANQYVKMRRVDNAVVTGTRNLAYTQGSVTDSAININDSYDGNMENLFLGNKHFNSGTDNIFGNQGDGNGNNNNIERVDVIFPGSFSATDNSKVGFAVFERGATTAHDPVKVAVILGLDSTGMPNSYSVIDSINSTTYGTTDVVAPRSYIIMRRDTATEPFKMSTTTNQAIGGVLFKYSDFGIPNNTPIYGYSVIPEDFPGTGTPADLIDYTNAANFPTNTSSSTGAGGIDLIAITGISESSPVVNFPISGNVYIDANGLQDGTVNGIGTNTGGKLYVQLLNISNTVISTVAVNSDGTYLFPAVAPGTYSIVLDTSSSSNSVASLPAGYVNTGENIGAGAGSDGTPNGIISSIIVNGGNVSNINFGIEQLPVSDNKTYTITKPVMNSAITLNGTGSVPGPLSGSDAEDGILGANDSLVITSVPSNANLYYKGILLANNSSIKNYDPSQLEIKFTSVNTSGTSFQYKFMDAAGNLSLTAATYAINWPTLLPVVLTSFNAIKENDYTVLNWATTSELDVKSFNVERSTDNGKSWQPVGEVIASGNSSAKKSYSFTDDNPESGTNLYRLQIEDNNGSFTYSKITQIEILDDGTMTLYPNPVGEEEALNIQLVGLKAGPYKISMVSASGQKVKEMTFNITTSGSALLVIPTGRIPRGTYVVIVNGNNQQYSKTVVIANR